MPTPKVEVIMKHTAEKEREHLDGKAKRMQVFLKKIAKSRKPSQFPSPFKTNASDTEKSEKISLALLQPLPVMEVTVPVEEKTAETNTNDLEKLKQYEKEVKSALTYYGVIVEKGFNQKLPGTATAVLESIINAETVLETCLKNMNIKDCDLNGKSSAKSRKEQLYHSITDLIRLSDDVLFDPSSNASIDKKASLEACKKVIESLKELYEYVLPRVTKFSVNAELLQCSASINSNNSLDTLEHIPETEVLDDIIDDDNLSRNSASISIHTQDSGFVSEINSDYTDDNETSTNEDLPPPKPPLPPVNRPFYANMNSNQIIRKTVSQPDDLMVYKKSRDPDFMFKVQRPISEMSSSSGLLNSSLGTNASNHSSKSSLSSCSSLNNNNNHNNKAHNFELTVDPAPIDVSIKRRIDSQSEKQVLSDSTLDSEENGFSEEDYSNNLRHYEHYELLARSSLCLCPTNNDDDEDLLSDDPPPPLYPKKKKHTVDNYMNLVDGYDAAGYHERPSSFYDNLLIPNAHRITEEELLNGDELPKLPPKRGSYTRNTSQDEPPPSPCKTKRTPRERKPRARRESTEAYREDNVPALDCKAVTRFLSFKDTENEPLLCGGTIDALIVHACSDSQHASLFYRAFIATYRTFVSSPELICKLLYRANRFQDKGSSEISRNSLRLLVDVINEVFEELDKSLFDQLRSQVHRLLNQGELAIAKNLRDRIVNYCIKIQVNPIPIYQPVKTESDLFEFKSTDLAQQMCVLDTDYFLKIELPEVLRWGKEQSETLSPNLSRFIGHFNNMSFWVRTLMINEHRQQEREKLYKKFLKIMRILRKLNNFSSFLAIMSALDSTPVRRLEWPKQLTEQLAEDTKLIDSQSAFKTYREALAEAKSPCIPYLGLILTDITFVHLGNTHTLPDGKINFLKRWQQFNILEGVRRFKESLYNFPRNEKIMDFFNEYDDHLDEDSLWEESIKLRPRGK